jgi:hypothetical protein
MFDLSVAASSTRGYARVADKGQSGGRQSKSPQTKEKLAEIRDILPLIGYEKYGTLVLRTSTIVPDDSTVVLLRLYSASWLAPDGYDIAGRNQTIN